MKKLKELSQFPTRSWWQWWSNWDDVCLFDYAGVGCVLQASRSRTGKLRFRVAEMKGFCGVMKCRSEFVKSQGDAEND